MTTPAGAFQCYNLQNKWYKIKTQLAGRLYKPAWRRAADLNYFRVTSQPFKLLDHIQRGFSVTFPVQISLRLTSSYCYVMGPAEIFRFNHQYKYDYEC